MEACDGFFALHGDDGYYMESQHALPVKVEVR